MTTNYKAGFIYNGFKPDNVTELLQLRNADGSAYTNFSCAKINTNTNDINLGSGSIYGASIIQFGGTADAGQIDFNITKGGQFTFTSDDQIWMNFTTGNKAQILFDSNGSIACPVTGTVSAGGFSTGGNISSGNISSSGVLSVLGTVFNQTFGVPSGNNWGFGREWGGYWNTGQQVNLTSNTVVLNYSITCASNIVLYAGSLYAFSDKRTKTNVVELNSFHSLNIIRNLTPINYEYIDQQGNKKLGFIAQDLKESIPTAISLNTNYIPNIYEIVKVTNKNRIHLDNKSKQDFDLKYNIIKLKFYIIDYSGQIKKELFGTIKEFIDDKSFTINEEIDEQFLVLYGQEVDDILGLDYNQTNIINISAVKQLDLELQETKETVVKQQQQIDNQKQQIDNQKQQIDHLTAELAALKALIMGRL